MAVAQEAARRVLDELKAGTLTGTEISSDAHGGLTAEKRGRYFDIAALSSLAAATFLLYFTGLGGYPLIDPAESYYSEAAREMVESADYITPHLNYNIYFSKPILTFWLIAGSYNLFGVGEFGSRLPFAALVLLLVVAVYFASKRLISARAGLFAGLITATTPLLMIYSRKSPIDIAFSCFLDIAVLATAVLLAAGKRRSRSWVLIYAGLALAVLTKGPAALVLYGIAALAFLAVKRPTWTAFKELVARLRPVAGLAVFLIITLPWHIAVSQATDGLFLKVFYLYENLARFGGHTNLGQKGPFFYVGILFLAFLPWSLFLPFVFKRPLLAHHEKDSPFDKSYGLAFLAVWCLSTVIFFSISATKLETYILPIFAPAAILIAELLDRWVEEREADETLATPILLKIFSWVLLAVGVAAGVGAVALPFVARGISPALIAVALAVAAMVATGAFVQWRAMRQGRLARSLYTTSAVVAAGATFVLPALFVYLGHKYYGGLETIAAKAATYDGKLSMFGSFSPASMFYARKPVDTFFHPHQLIVPEGRERDKVSQLVLIKDNALARFEKVPATGVEKLEAAPPWGLYRFSGVELESVHSLESVFRNQKSFDMILKGKGGTGPLTVPYAAGDKDWSKPRQ